MHYDHIILPLIIDARTNGTILMEVNDMSRVLETDESGSLTIPADLLSETGPHTEYTAERSGIDLVIRPKAEDSIEEPREWERWLAERDELARQIGAAWKIAKSAAEVI